MKSSDEAICDPMGKQSFYTYCMIHLLYNYASMEQNISA